MLVLDRKRSWLTALGTAALLSAGAAPGHALTSSGFEGAYAPANWAFSTEGDGTGSSVDTSGAAASITLFGPDGGIPDVALGDAPGAGFFTTTAVAPGLVSFDWSYVTGLDEFSAYDDPFGYFLNGSRFQLSEDFSTNQSAFKSFNVALGDTFGFYVATVTSQFGGSTVTISNFSAPIPDSVPVPGPLPLLGAAAAFRASRRIRVRLRATAKSA